MRGKIIAALVSLLLLVGALAAVAILLFQVRVIKVSGCGSLDAQEVAALSGIKIGQNIFFVDKQAAMESLAGNPVVKPVSVKVVYPYTVEIAIEERTAAAYIDVGSVRLTIDSEAVVIAVDDNPQGDALPQAAGFSTARFELGHALGEDAYKREVFTRLLTALAGSGIEYVCIDLTYASAIKLTTADGFIVELGNEDNLTIKFSLTLRMMEEAGALGKSGGIIDVTTAKKAYYREN